MVRPRLQVGFNGEEIEAFIDIFIVGFLVCDDGDSLLAQSTIEKLQQEKAKHKTIKLDIAHLSSCVSLVPQPILYDRNDII